MNKTWVYSGVFDPITVGHLDIIRRAAPLCDRLIVGIGVNSLKSPVFSPDERTGMILRCVEGLPNVSVAAFSGLLIDFVRAQNACAVVRGIRSYADFEYESQVAAINRHIAADVETVYLAAAPRYNFISSSVVRELGRYDARLDDIVPSAVLAEVKARFAAIYK